MEKTINSHNLAQILNIHHDKNVESIRAELLSRSKVGIEKYGVTTDRSDLTLIDWLQHALEESLDHAVYLQAAITKLKNGGRND
jgi:hypothetical protein